MTKITSKFTNPFHWVVDQLTDEELDVDIPFLKMFAYELEKFSVTLETYGDLVEVLAYLHDNNALTLTHNPDGTISIKKAYYG